MPEVSVDTSSEKSAPMGIIPSRAGEFKDTTRGKSKKPRGQILTPNGGMSLNLNEGSTRQAKGPSQFKDEFDYLHSLTKLAADVLLRTDSVIELMLGEVAVTFHSGIQKPIKIMEGTKYHAVPGREVVIILDSTEPNIVSKIAIRSYAGDQALTFLHDALLKNGLMLPRHRPTDVVNTSATEKAAV